MIYLKNISDPQFVRIPVSGPTPEGVITLEMENTINRGGARSFTYDPAIYFVDADGKYFHDADGLQLVVGTVEDGSRLYAVIEITLDAGMPDGEYEYKAIAGGEVLSCGLAIVGDPKARVTSYDNNQRYEQYQSES